MCSRIEIKIAEKEKLNNFSYWFGKKLYIGICGSAAILS